jgi:hypothetical protein
VTRAEALMDAQARRKGPRAPRSGPRAGAGPGPRSRDRPKGGWR